MAQIISFAELQQKQFARLQPIEMELAYQELYFWKDVHKELEKLSLDHLEEEKRWEWEEFIESFGCDLEMFEELGKSDTRFCMKFSGMDILVMQQALKKLEASPLKDEYEKLFGVKV